MMTVIYRGRRARRYLGRKALVTTWWPMSTQEHDRRTAGSAKSGRGGRRKRKAWAAIRRDMDARMRHVEAMRALPKEQKRRFVYRARFRRWMMQDLERAWIEGPGLKPPPGRRERRRRAKLRRRWERRARRGAAAIFLEIRRMAEEESARLILGTTVLTHGA